MRPEQMKQIIHAECNNVEEEHNVVEFIYDDIPIILVYDENADRMRLMSAILRTVDLQENQLYEAMEANFHTALDARYAINNEIVWAAFIHPLSNLSADLFVSAIGQVAAAHKTFGTEYQSSNLVFSPG